jgi:two-component system sensor histidine kinase HydH
VVGSLYEAQMGADPPGLDEIQAREIGRIVGRMFVVRVFILPVLAIVGAFLVFLDPDAWRIGLVVGALVCVIGVAFVEYLRHRSHDPDRNAVVGNILVMGLFQLLLIAASGGVSSPLAPVAVVYALVSGLVLRRTRTLAASLAVQWVLIAAMTLGPTTGLLPDLRLEPLSSGPADRTLLWTAGTVLAAMCGVAAGAGTVFRGAIDAMVRQALLAHASERLAQESHARELVQLGAEIAHELKNPLASVKGLGALLARDAEGRSAERLGVLRGEVDRMQDIVAGFLDFSRPIGPLALVEVDLRQLARDVAGLSEGVAGESGVELRVAEGDPVVVRADRRKVLQILVNIVQNAVQVSAKGGRVQLVVARSGDEAVVDVEDEGPGLADAVREHLFEVGFTTRAEGSGLGLPMARGLARQHGGDLTLAPREGRGTRARLRLPLAGPASQADPALEVA